MLSTVQHWPVFRSLPELFIMVPALIGLKGNLEMTLASRLSTHANLGHLDTLEQTLEMGVANLALTQVLQPHDYSWGAGPRSSGRVPGLLPGGGYGLGC